MTYHAQEPTFLPLTLAAARAAAGSALSPAQSAAGMAVRRRAEAADAAAAACWTALLAGCDSPARHRLPFRLRELTEATSSYVGQHWWLTDGAVHRHRVAEAEDRIDEATREGDGAEFAEAFVGYDQAVATAVVRVRRRIGSPTP